MKRYKYEIEFDMPNYFVVFYSDTKLSSKEIQKRAFEELTRKTLLWDVQMVDTETDEKVDLNEKLTQDLAPGI